MNFPTLHIGLKSDDTTGPVFREHPHKRRNLARWRENRARRLTVLASLNYATPRQLARLRQLAPAKS